MARRKGRRLPRLTGLARGVRTSQAARPLALDRAMRALRAAALPGERARLSTLFRQATAAKSPSTHCAELRHPD
jgi:hypothetical protein